MKVRLSVTYMVTIMYVVFISFWFSPFARVIKSRGHDDHLYAFGAAHFGGLLAGSSLLLVLDRWWQPHPAKLAITGCAGIFLCTLGYGRSHHRSPSRDAHWHPPVHRRGASGHPVSNNLSVNILTMLSFGLIASLLSIQSMWLAMVSLPVLSLLCLRWISLTQPTAEELIERKRRLYAFLGMVMYLSLHLRIR